MLEKTVKLLNARNVTSGFLDIEIFSENGETVNIRILDMLKNQKLSLWQQLSSGTNKIPLDLSSLPKGFYRIWVTLEKGRILSEDFTKY